MSGPGDGAAARASELAGRLHAALVESSKVSLAGSVPDYLLLPCVEAGLVSPELALAMTRRQPRDCGRALCLVRLCGFLPAADRPAVLAEALSILRLIEDPFQRVCGLEGIVDHLDAEERSLVLGEMLAAVSAIEPEAHREGPLAALADHLPPDAELWRTRILAAARAIEDPEARANALAVVITDVLTAEERTPKLLAEALEAATLAGGDEALRALVPCLIGEASSLLACAVAIACRIEDASARASALEVVVQHLPPDRSAPWDRVWEATCGLESGEKRLAVLAAMAAHHPPDRRPALLVEILATARALDAEPRALALTRVAGLLLPAEGRSQILAEALDGARALEDEGDRAHVLTGMLAAESPAYPPDLLAALLELARVIVDGKARAYALMGAAERVPVEQRSAVLAAALAGVRAMPSPQDVAEGLMYVSFALAPAERSAVLEEALAAIRVVPLSIEASLLVDSASGETAFAETAHLPGQILAEELGDFEGGVVGSWVFSELVPHLLPSDRAEALSKALAIDRVVRDHGDRARALVAISTYLPPAEVGPLLDEALAITRTEPAVRRGDSLVKVTADLPMNRADVPAAVDEEAELSAALASCAGVTRGQALAFVVEALPLLVRLGGLDLVRAAAAAIRDVTRRWP